MKKFSQNYNNNRNNNGGRGSYKKNYNKWYIPSYLSPYDRTLWLLNTFTHRKVERRANDSNESMIRRFKRVVDDSGVLKELRNKEYHMSASQKQKVKSAKARKRLRRFNKNQSFYDVPDFDTKMEAYQAASFVDERVSH